MLGDRTSAVTTLGHKSIHGGGESVGEPPSAFRIGDFGEAME